jgi:hypothetical protein
MNSISSLTADLNASAQAAGNSRLANMTGVAGCGPLLDRGSWKVGRRCFVYLWLVVLVSTLSPLQPERSRRGCSGARAQVQGSTRLHAVCESASR